MDKPLIHLRRKLKSSQTTTYHSKNPSTRNFNQQIEQHPSSEVISPERVVLFSGKKKSIDNNLHRNFPSSWTKN